MKSGGKGKLAFVEPFVPLGFVEGKGYTQELLELSLGRSMPDWELLFL